MKEAEERGEGRGDGGRGGRGGGGRTTDRGVLTLISILLEPLAVAFPKPLQTPKLMLSFTFLAQSPQGIRIRGKINLSQGDNVSLPLLHEEG